MLVAIDSFVRSHQQPLLALYLASLFLTLLALVILIWRWSRALEQVPVAGADIGYRSGLPPGLAIVVGLLFLLLFVPFVVDHLKSLDRILFRNPGYWILGLIPLTGMVLIGYGIRSLWTARRHRECLVVAQSQLSPGGWVSGEFVIHNAGKAAPQARVHLVLQDVHVFHWLRGERQLFQHSIWSDSQEVPARIRGEVRIVPFRFRLPKRLPTEASRWQRREWIVVLELPGYGRLVRVLHAEEGLGRSQKRLSLRELWNSRTPTQATPQGVPWRPFATELPGRNPLLELGVALFVAVFPWLFWFAMDNNERSWAHLGNALPSVLLPGAAILSLFCTALFALLRWVLSDAGDLPELAKKWLRLARIGLPIALVGDAVFLALGAWHLTGTHGQGFDPDAIKRMLLHGVIGMFLWIGTLTLVLTIASLLRGRQRPNHVSDENRRPD